MDTSALTTSPPGGRDRGGDDALKAADPGASRSLNPERCGPGTTHRSGSRLRWRP